MAKMMGEVHSLVMLVITNMTITRIALTSKTSDDDDDDWHHIKIKIYYISGSSLMPVRS